MHGKAGLDRVIHHLAVEHRQCAGQTHADRAALGVGCRAEGGGTAAEDFGFGFQFGVDLQADDHFITFVKRHTGFPPISSSSAAPAR